MECQLRVCLSQNLSLSLKKTHIFLQRMEFVGINVSPGGNCPVMSKHQLLATWPHPAIVRDIAAILGFANFYASFIPHFETCVSRLCEITKLKYLEQVGSHFDVDASVEWGDIKSDILADPCLCRFDHRRCIYIRTDFSAKVFGYVALQPGDDNALLAAMWRKIAGAGCECMVASSTLILHPLAFGGRRACGNESWLHSYLGKTYLCWWLGNQ